MIKRGLLSIALGLALSVLNTADVTAAPDPALFGQKPTAHDAAISPNGHQVAILQNHKGQYLVNIVDLRTLGQNVELRVIGLDQDIQPQFIKWVSNDRVIVSVRQSQRWRGTPFSMGFLHSIDTTNMKARLLVDSGGDGALRQFNNQVLDWLEDDPEHIIMQYAEDGRPQTYPDVRRVKVANGRDRVIQRSMSGIVNWVTDSEGVPRVGVGWRDDGKTAHMVIKDPLTDDWEKFDKFPGLDPETMSVLSVSADGRNLIVRAYRAANTLGLHKYDLEQKAFTDTIYQNDTYDVGDVILSKDGDRIMGVSFTGESDERVLFDEYNSTMEEALSQFADFDVKFVDQSEDARQLLIRLSGPSEPGGLFLFERGGDITSISSHLDGLSAEDMGEVISVKYRARDGEAIPAFVTVPKTVEGSLKNLPFIILPHGGPFSRDAKEFDWLAQFFASRGYGVLQMNFRGSTGYGREFKEAGRDQWTLMKDDVEDGMRWLLEKGYADPDRSCIAGWSYGGYAALMGVANDPELYKCAVAIAALSDIPGAIADARQYTHGKARAARTFAALIEDKELMRQNNPVDRAEDIKVPVFLAHGRNDVAVDYDQYRKMKRRLEKADVDGTYMSFDDEDHYMSTQANRQAMIVGIAEFLDKVNGPSPFLPE